MVLSAAEGTMNGSGLSHSSRHCSTDIGVSVEVSRIKESNSLMKVLSVASDNCYHAYSILN